MCTFGTTPSELGKAYLSREGVLEIARAGERAGCREALVTLGDRPEARYAAARDALTQSGHDSTLSYLGDMARAVLEETGLLPHLNPGLLGAEDYAALRPYAASMGILLESASERLCEHAGPHFGWPVTRPAAPLPPLPDAGRANWAF